MYRTRGIVFSMAIGNLQFLQATSPQYFGQTQRAQGFQPQTQGVPNTTARIEPSFKPSIEDYEKAQAFIDGDYKVGGNIFTQGIQKTANPKGAAFEGFSVPTSNGTGELSPVIAGREDEIIGLDLRA